MGRWEPSAQRRLRIGRQWRKYPCAGFKQRAMMPTRATPSGEPSVMADQQKPWVPLSSAELNVEVNPLGAQLSVFRDRSGRDLLWDGDPAVWAGRAPLLFPTIGEVAGGSYRLGSQTYRLSRHGFARGK